MRPSGCMATDAPSIGSCVERGGGLNKHDRFPSVLAERARAIIRCCRLGKAPPWQEIALAIRRGFWETLDCNIQRFPGFPGMKPALSAGFSILGFRPPSVVLPESGEFRSMVPESRLTIKEI